MTTKLDPITGPLSRDEFAECITAPFGEAKKVIRKHDPFWGLSKGEKIDFEVTVSAIVTGRAIVSASNQEEADSLADKLTEHDVDWGGYGCDDIDVITVEPAKRQR